MFSIVAQVLVVYMYNDKLFGVHVFEMTLDRYNWFQLVRALVHKDKIP